MGYVDRIAVLQHSRNLFNSFFRTATDLILVLSVSPNKRVFVLGDSHVLPLGSRRGVFRKHLGPITLNRFGRTNEARNSFRSISRLWPTEREAQGPHSLPTIVLSFGEIDLRVHVLRQARIRSISTSEVVSLLVQSAVNAISELRQITQARIVMLAPTPPTDVAFNPLFPVSGSLADRISWNRQYSSEIKSRIAEIGLENVKLLDVSHLFVTSAGSLAESFSDGNVHYSRQAGRFIIDIIRGLDQAK